MIVVMAMVVFVMCGWLVLWGGCMIVFFCGNDRVCFVFVLV